MKRFAALLLTSTSSLGAGYYFGYRHQEVQRPSVSSIRSEGTLTNLPIPPTPPTHHDQEIQTSSSVVVEESDTKLESTKSEENIDEKRKTTLEEIYQYLEDKNVDGNNDSIHWPKYNIHFLSDDKEENREDTIKLFKTFEGFGIPTHVGAINLFSHFISVSDSRMKIPLYVAWSIPHLTNEMKPTSNRKHSRFAKGSFYDNFTSFNPDNSDYLGSGYSRGHMVNCGDFNYFDQNSMNDTHLLIHNIVPQNFQNNSGYWLRMERFTRSLAYDFDSVHVIAGPAMIPEMSEQKEVNGKLQTPTGILKHLVVGKHQVAVPTHLFRIIIAEKNVNSKPEYYAQAFLVPNTELEKTDPLPKYSISLQELEGVTGLRFLDKLSKSGNMFPLCNHWHDEKTIVVSDVSAPSDDIADKQLETESNVTPQVVPQDKVLLEETVLKYGCDCIVNFPPWQDLDIQELLWKKQITSSEIEEQWNHLIETTNWTPSKDIVERKTAKLEQLKRDAANNTVNTPPSN